MAEVMKCGELFMQLQENVINNNLHYWQVYCRIQGQTPEFLTWDFQDPLNGADMKDLAEIQKQVLEPHCTLCGLHRSLYCAGS